MTNLTDKWKKGELPNGIYYVELLGGNTTIAYMYKIRSYKKIVYRVKSFKGYVTKNQMKAVLSELPTYEEWKASENYIDYLKQCISVYESKDKQATETSIAYNELLEENTKLKERNDSLNNRDINLCIIANNIRDENFALKTDCHTLAQKLLQVKPELREWLEVNYGEYL